jgi:hypothetical protein
MCNQSIPPTDLAKHYSAERRSFLSSISIDANSRKRPAAVLALSKIVDRPTLPKRTEVSTLLSRVRTNREQRRSGVGYSVEESSVVVDECPVCGIRIQQGEDVITHVSACLDSQRQRIPDEVDLRNLGNVSISTGDESLEVFVDVENDIEAVYGTTQYSEEDLTRVALPSEISSSTRDMRCNVCLNGYSVPVISVQCFHVYCERCWLQSLRTKKLCPQCRTITQPSDLRRIYL